MGKRKLIRYWLFLYICAIAPSAGARGAKPEIQPKPDSVLNTDDGPHILLKDDSTAILFYSFENKIHSETIPISDTINFTGWFADSLFEYKIPVNPPDVGPYIFDNVNRIMAVSDIHGEYDYLVEFLRNNGIIDDGLNWSWGDGHLVIDGDIFDRGDKVSECLWLIYRLEQQATEQGGYVHYLLGNHEAMVMQGDLRYVNERYLKGIVKYSKIKYADLFGPDMVLGRWLRTKHTAIKINDIIFTHAGLSSEMVSRGMDIGYINSAIRENIDDRSYKIVFNDDLKYLYGGRGPLWYRGLITDELYPLESDSQLTDILSYYDSDRIVVGHTENDQISVLYDSRVIAIDIPVDILYGFQGLLIDNGKIYRVSSDGKKEPIE